MARAVLDSFVDSGSYEKWAKSESYLSEKRGVFVTLNTFGGAEMGLRGCMGFPFPMKPLGEALQEATVLAASEDPRFDPVAPGELGNIVVEVSVLTQPVELKVKTRKEMPNKIKIGEDGLMISTEFAGGLLLPQVAPEQRWGAEEFLSQACLKAGLNVDAWLLPGTRVQTFQADIFTEKSPKGEVEQVKFPVS